jgi:aspartyl-tRNA(Asn)/glutamyl-tRNA(Gln) amidotransferase subunit C
MSDARRRRVAIFAGSRPSWLETFCVRSCNIADDPAGAVFRAPARRRNCHTIYAVIIFATLSAILSPPETSTDCSPPMPLELSDVKRLATLAQLDIDDQQSARTLDKLNGIFDLVERMKAVDTTGVLPLSQPMAAYQDIVALRLRDDAVTEADRRDEYQKPAPAVRDGLYLVPKVID